MKNFQEVEKRIILTPEQRDRVIAEITAMGALHVKDQTIVDDYFCDKKCKSFAETAMKDVGSYGLRIREKTEDGQTESQLNIKVITEEDNHRSWEEHETEVGDAEEMANILDALGFKSFYSFKKERAVYKLDDLEILIEDIEDFGPIIEIEGKTRFEDSAQMEDKIVKFLEKLKLDPSDIVPKSVTYILMEKGSKF